MRAPIDTAPRLFRKSAPTPQTPLPHPPEIGAFISGHPPTPAPPRLRCSRCPRLRLRPRARSETGLLHPGPRPRPQSAADYAAPGKRSHGGERGGVLVTHRALTEPQRRLEPSSQSAFVHTSYTQLFVLPSDIWTLIQNEGRIFP